MDTAPIPPTAPTAPSSRFNESERGPAASSCPGEDFLVLEEGLPDAPPSFDDPWRDFEASLPYPKIMPTTEATRPVSLLVVIAGQPTITKEAAGRQRLRHRQGPARLVRKAPSITCWACGQPNLLIVRPRPHRKGSGAIFPVAQEKDWGLRGKIPGLPGQFRAVAAETRCHFLDANALGLAAQPH